MSKEIYISSTPHETRLAIVENDALAEMYYERENEYTLAGSIYNGKVTRVLPGMQSSFVDIGLERDAFLYITDFMEEAGDTADFEANANAGDARRAPRESRPDRGSDRSADRGPVRVPDRFDRDSERAARPERAEPTDSELFTDAVASLEPTRSAPDRNSDRNRRGGRNRRDRNFNSDGTPRRDRGADRNAEPNPDRNRDRHSDGSLESAHPVLADTTSSSPEPIIEAHPDAELGEGAPGADGSRRWRGRRGRRGNRAADASGSREASSQAQPVSSATHTGPVEDAYADAYASEPDLDLDASAAAVEPVQPAAQPPVDAAAPRSPREDRSGRSDRNRPDRSQDRSPDRSPDRGQAWRQDRSSQQQPPRAPRGFAPTASLYKVEAETEPRPYGQEEELAGPLEPIILPGESLGKYRPASENAAPAAAAAPPPPTQEFVAAGWDGGFVLPGETIRPRNPSASADSSRDAGSRDPRNDRGSRDSRGRERRPDGRGGRDSRDSTRSRDTGNSRDADGFRSSREPRPQTFPAPVAPMESAPEPQGFSGHAAAQAETSDLMHPQVPTQTSTFVPPPPMPEPLVEMVEEHEYEPAEASASYRIDPAPPSQYVQAAPAVEDAAATTEEPALPEPRHTITEFLEHEAEEFNPPTLTPETGSAKVAFETHEITSISASGNMESDAPQVTAHALSAPSETLQGPPASSVELPEDAVAADQALPYFAPGDGLLEEEEFLEEDEEVTALPTLHAQSNDDPHDQETLEGAADLASMIEELSIDQLTRADAPQDGDEEFLEEDQDYENFDDSELDSSEIEEESAAQPGFAENNAEGFTDPEAASDAVPEFRPADSAREPRPERGRRDGRRGDRNRRPGSGERSSSGSDRPRRDPARGGGRQSMQSTNLPAISDLLKPGQELLCQIAKEPIAKKGARITSHIALPGRFLVFMPTVSHTGVSRKIESDGERRRLKEILLSERGEASGGFIVRTAASGASEEELRSDLRFLLNLWADIKARSEASKSPALIYHDLNLIERVLRDQVTDTFSAIWVDTETEYERVLRFLQRFQPSLIRRVKLYTKETPLFEQFGITEEINKALRSKVWLKSGGSIVINQTEALVAIDINTGKFVGKTARLEDTIVKTNLDAIPEIVRQIRLRDLGGIIIIDFIDMDERKNRNKVMAALEEELKSDRAPSKVLQFNDFGLVAITRKRVKQSLERTLSTTCGVCAGTGMTKSPITICNDIYVEMRKMNKHLDRGDVMLRVHPEVVKQLKSGTSRWLQEMEEMVGKTILVKSDPGLHPEQFDIH